MKVGERNLITDVEGILVGNAEDARIKTGTTVLTGTEPFVAAVHVMGGAPGTRETDLLAPDRLVQEVDAIVLSGGSAFGLDAASGAADALAKRGRGFKVGSATVPIVPAAILFDLLNGGMKNWVESPYFELGARALESADEDFRLGTAGAGYGATTMQVKGGLGSASVVTSGGYTVGSLAAINSLGSVLQAGGPCFWAAPFEIGNEFGGLGASQSSNPLEEASLPMGDPPVNANTSIAIVATDAALTQSEATRMAVCAHDGFARAIVPSHTLFDGDLAFAVSTGKRPLKEPHRDMFSICHAAAACLSRATARAVYLAEPEGGDTLPAWKEKFARTEGG